MNNEKITRREALKTMAAAGTGLAVAGTILESCRPGRTDSKDSSPKGPAPEGSKVTSRVWPKLGDTVSLLGLGCMRFPRSGGRIDQEQVNAMVDYALAHGVNYYDTAPAYGDSEVATGIALKRHERSTYYIATKLSNQRGAHTYEDGVAMFERSLTNLQTDYVDYLLLHSLGNPESLKSRFLDNGLLNYLIEQKAKGRIRHLGFSYHGSNDNLIKILDGNYYDWDFVQIQMNYLDWKSMNGSKDTDAETLYKALEQRGIPATIMEPVRGGALANVSDAMKGKLSELHPDLSPAGVALSFVATYPNVLNTLSGMSNMEQLVENVATFTDFKPFTDKEIEAVLRLADTYNSNKHIPCTTCRYCMPCPSNVDIPGNFTVYNTTSDELNLPDPDGPHDKEYKQRRRILLNRYNKDLVKGTSADFCTQCKVCVSKCPQHINIPSQMVMIRDLIKSIS